MDHGANTTQPRLGGGEHPGQFLRHELADRGCTQAQFAEIIGRRASVLSEIFNAKKAITADTAIQLEQALGISAERWLYAQADHELQRARGRHNANWPYPTCINDEDPDV